MRCTSFVLACCAVLTLATSAGAQQSQVPSPDPSAAQTADPDPSAAQTAGQTPRPIAINYSQGYETRARIHKYASFATLPLFATELALGQSIFNDPNAHDSAARSA